MVIGRTAICTNDVCTANARTFAQRETNVKRSMKPPPLTGTIRVCLIRPAAQWPCVATLVDIGSYSGFGEKS
jgi:hypothetical protein